MPKVDPESGEPMSDAPDSPDETRGGMQAGDPGLAGATETGGKTLLNRPNTSPDDNSSTRNVGEKPSDGEGL